MSASPADFREAFDLDAPPDVAVPEGAVAAVVLAHDEALRLPQFLQHHRALGVSRFFVIDNASTDGTAALLDAAPDVTRLPSSRPYREFKSRWREIVADRWLVGRWTAFLDVDELLIPPFWPEADLPRLCAFWTAQGADAVFCSMVDMYAAEGAPAQSEGSLIDLCPWFDGDGYRRIPVGPRMLRRYPCPPEQIYGGARERLFHPEAARPPSGLERALERAAFPVAGPPGPAPLRWLARRILRRRWPDDPPVMSKVALLRWEAGLRFSGGVHRLNRPRRLAEDEPALLHFKYLADFDQKVRAAVARGQHAGGAAHYRVYRESLEGFAARSCLYPGSRRFTGPDDLESAGLLRVGATLRAAFRGRSGQGERA
jgi:hypothetical protein